MIKYLISRTPQWVIKFMGGGGGIKKISEESGYMDNLPSSDTVLAERGFDISELVGMQAAEVH